MIRKHGSVTIWRAIVGFFLLMSLAAAAAADQILLLAVVINSYPTGKVGEFVVHDGMLFVRSREMRELGLLPPVSAAGEDLIALDGLTDFSYRLDQRSATLYVAAGASRLQPVMLGAPSAPETGVPIESGVGATLNYDLIGTSFGGRGYANGWFDARAFSPWGVLSSGLLAHAGPETNGSGGYSALRLDSTYVYSDPASLRRYRAGDFISGFLPWVRPVRLGGVQITSDFTMRPDLITFPLPSLGGMVTVPSTVDVLVNGNRVLSQPVAPGPFQVPQLPVVTGQSTVELTVTNALGQQVTSELPFYAVSSLLAPGLQTYSIEGGWVRRNWGIVSDEYGAFAGALTYRRGISDNLTLEGHTEASRGVFMGGIGGVMNLADVAQVDLSVAGSAGAGFNGLQFSAGIQHTGPRFNLGASVTWASHDFGDMAAANGDPIVQLRVNANAGISLGSFGSFGIAYTGIERAASRTPANVFAPPEPILTPDPNVLLFQPAIRSHIVSASYSAQIGGRAMFYATAFHDFAHERDLGVSIGILIPLGSRSSAGVNAQSGSGIRSVQLQADQTASTVGDWGYRALLSGEHRDAQGSIAADTSDHEFAEVSYKSPWGMAFAGIDHFGNKTTLQAEARGAVSFTDGDLFLSNHIDDSFAIVDTNGVKGITVLQENRFAGVTDSSGKLLVPELRAFEINHLSIDPLDVPIDTDVPFATRETRPQDRSGVVVQFPLKPAGGALLILADDHGEPIPVGSMATLQATGVTVPVGYDGETYLTGLQPRNEVRVELPDGRKCAVDFAYRPLSGEVPTIGPLACRETMQ